MPASRMVVIVSSRYLITPLCNVRAVFTDTFIHGGPVHQFDDDHIGILINISKMAHARCVAHAASWHARIAGISEIGGKTFQDPSSCRKKKITSSPSGRTASMRT